MEFSGWPVIWRKPEACGPKPEQKYCLHCPGCFSPLTDDYDGTCWNGTLGVYCCACVAPLDFSPPYPIREQKET